MPGPAQVPGNAGPPAADRPSANTAGPGARFAEILAAQLPGTIAAATGEKPEVRAESLAAAPAELEWWRQPFLLDAAPGAAGAGETIEAWIGFDLACWRDLGARALEAAGIEDDAQTGARAAFLDLLHQALSASAFTFAARIQRPFALGAGQDAASAPPVEALRLQFEFPGPGGAFTLFLHLAGFDSIPPPGAGAAPATGRPADGDGRYDVLLDVELPVSVSFGRALLPLKEVLKLTSGSIVELSRGVLEPVELIVNNCVVARGEVVVVEGNYGVRITQIISRGERLRSLP